MNPFFIATTQRSGGFFLMSLLNSTEKVGYVHEYLYYLHEGWEGDSPTDAEILTHFDRFKETALDGCEGLTGHWGTKVDIRELQIVERWLKLSDMAPQSIKWIWLRRRNKLRQAISLIKAQKSQIWHLDNDDPREKQDKARAEMAVDFHELCVKAIQFYVGDDAWNNFFRINNITPCTLYYEDFVDESTWKLTIENIFDYIGVPYDTSLNVSTHRLKQGVGKAPESYISIVNELMKYDLPIEYAGIDTEGCYELDLETF